MSKTGARASRPRLLAKGARAGRPRLLAVVTLFCLAFVAGAADDTLARWQEYRDRLAKDPSVLRLYGFDEARGQVAANAAANHEGALLLPGYSASGLYRGWPRWPAPAPADCPRWTQGRWPGKSALACGLAPTQALRSRFYGTAKGVFSVSAWLRVHELGESEWGGTAILNMGSAYKEGWRIVIERQKWCRNGAAMFRLGVPEGGAATTPMNEFTFGVWHHLAAVWDGQAITCYVDGKPATLPTAGPCTAPQPYPYEAENDLGGMVLGGKLRYDLDELAIYDRALPAAEIGDLVARFRPEGSPEQQRQELRRQLAAAAALDRLTVVWPRESGGYFPVGQPLVAALRGPAAPGLPAVSARWTVRRGEGKTVVYERDEALPDLAAKGADLAFVFTPERCGLYTATLTLHTAAGQTLRQQEFPLGVGLAPAANGDPAGFVLGVGHGPALQPAAAAVGVTWGRVVFDWSRLEPGKGLYAWEEADRRMDSATGLRVLACVTGWPGWLQRDTEGGRLPASLDAYGEFLRVLANRYRGRIGAWEIGDAPAGPPHFVFRHAAGAADYARLVRAAAATLRRESPQALLLGCGQAGDAQDFAIWPAQALAAAPGALDGLVYQYSPGVPAAPRNVAALAKLRGGAAPDGELRHWNTACGYLQPASPIGTLDLADFAAQPAARRLELAGGVPALKTWPCLLFSARQAAWRQVQQVLLERAAGAGAVFLANDPGDCYPRWNACDGDPTEMGLALAAMQALVPAQPLLPERLPAGKLPVTILRWAQPGQTPVQVWLAETPVQLRVSFGAETVEARDWLGNPLPLPPPDAAGKRLLDLDGTPLYLFTPAVPRDLESR